MLILRRHAVLSALLFVTFVSLTTVVLAADAAIEKELLAVLLSEDSSSADKAITCKKLAVHGTGAAVPEVAKLLPDPQLSSWARIALEAIPGPEADEALRKAAESLDGRLLIGVLNSIGVRRDAKAVEVLTARLKDQDAEVASAAAVALGHIGDAAATKTLRAALASVPDSVRSAVAEGCVLCAERLHTAGQSADAVAIYDEVRSANVPKPRLIEATRGTILARGKEGYPMLIELLQSNDKGLFNIALSTIREVPGSEIDKLLPAEVARVTPARGALIIQAMADRPTTVVVSAVVEAAGSGSKPVRLAAIAALATIGDVASLPVLLEAAVDADADLARVARNTLADLPGKAVDTKIAALLPGAKGKSYPMLLETVGRRRIEATSELLKAVDHVDKEVRSAGLVALGETVTLKNLPVLVTQAVSPKHADTVDVARQALKSASVRMPDRDACVTQLAAAIEKSPADAKIVVLEIISEVGGDKALTTVASVAKGNDPALQDAGSRLLGKWATADAGPVLLDLAKSGPPQYRTRSLRGFIGVVRKFPVSDQERSQMAQSALDLAKQPAEQKLVLDVLKIHPSLETLQLAVKLTQNADLRDEATQAAIAIAQKLTGKAPAAKVGEQLAAAGLGKVKLEIIKAEYGSGDTQRDVTEVFTKLAPETQFITLPSPNYNEAFGGDPAPNTVKQLKVQYKLNDKLAEATFPENALIILPLPK